jgi:hypothetical protein
MAMKKIKPQYGKVVPPAVKVEEERSVSDNEKTKAEIPTKADETKHTRSVKKTDQKKENLNETEAGEQKKPVSPITADPNPFMQTKEVFNQANLTKIGYRMRTEYVEILDIIKKLKKGGYTLEAVLDDALTYYFENSEDGKDALKRAEIFYS